MPWDFSKSFKENMNGEKHPGLAKYSQGLMPAGWELNHSDVVVDNIIKALERSNGYCPCGIEQEYNTLCRCAHFRNGDGCRCGLYVSKE